MTIKKPVSKMTAVKPAAAAAGTTEGSPAAGGATIADRFKLTPTEPIPQGALVNKKASMYALIAGLLALAAAGILAYILYQHWEFLMPA